MSDYRGYTIRPMHGGGVDIEHGGEVVEHVGSVHVARAVIDTYVDESVR